MLSERVSRLQQKVSKLKEQMHELGQMEQRLETSGERQVSLSDPDARSMASHGKATGIAATTSSC